MSENLNVQEQLERTSKEVGDLKKALDQSSIVAFTDAHGTITYVNDKFCQISQYSREELIGQNHRIINSGHHSKEFFAELWRTISSGGTWKGEIKNRAKDGSYYWVFTTIVPFMSEQNKPFKYVAIRTDITEQKLTQEEAERQRAALMHSEKMASVGELAAGIAHELGNPLGALSGRLELLKMRIQSGEAGHEETLQTIATFEKLSERMAAIIRGMMALSRDGTNDAFQKVSLGRLIQDVLAFTWESFQKKGIEIRCAEIDERLWVQGQETQLGQVFVNLVNNARDAILQLDEKWIQLEAIDLGSWVEVSITDSGKGIPPRIREKIMAPFFTTKPMGKGSGLGLSVSRTIVENHGGSLRIDADFPNTRFVVRLPKGGTKT